MVDMPVGAGRLIPASVTVFPASVRTRRSCCDEIDVIVPSSRFAIFSAGTGAVNCSRSPTANVRAASR
jgi:hypothetical protein